MSQLRGGYACCDSHCTFSCSDLHVYPQIKNVYTLISSAAAETAPVTTRSVTATNRLTLSVNMTCTFHSMLFGHVARADKSQDHSRALQACISPALRNWRRRPGRPRHTWLRTVEEDLRQFNLGLASGLRRAQNRTAWRTLTGTATSPTSSD